MASEQNAPAQKRKCTQDTQCKSIPWRSTSVPNTDAINVESAEEEKKEAAHAEEEWEKVDASAKAAQIQTSRSYCWRLSPYS